VAGGQRVLAAFAAAGQASPGQLPGRQVRHWTD
jgi:hypothetical protein